MRQLRALLPVVVLLAACSNPTGQSKAQSIPDMERRRFYEPKPVGAEAKVRERLEAWGKVRKDGR